MNGCKERDVPQICVQCLKRICTARAVVKEEEQYIGSKKPENTHEQHHCYGH